MFIPNLPSNITSSTQIFPTRICMIAMWRFMAMKVTKGMDSKEIIGFLIGASLTIIYCFKFRTKWSYQPISIPQLAYIPLDTL